MKPITVLDLTKCSADEIAGLRRDSFNVPPNVHGGGVYRRWNTVDMDWEFVTP